MSVQTKIYVIILGLWLVNYLPRVVPMVVLSKLRIPEPVILWLSFVPAAVLAAIIVPSVLMPDKQLFLSLKNTYLLSAVPALATAIKTRSLVCTLIVGMAAMAMLQLI